MVRDPPCRFLLQPGLPLGLVSNDDPPSLHGEASIVLLEIERDEAILFSPGLHVCVVCGCGVCGVCVCVCGVCVCVWCVWCAWCE